MKPARYYSRLSKTDTSLGGNLPHWSQSCATFVTFRLADSLPQEKILAYEEERREWIGLHPEPWDERTITEYTELFPDRFQHWLDAGNGSCVLREPSTREIVESTLRYFADKRYSLYAYVVMPNHVHVLYMPEDGFDGRDIVTSWKRYSARAVNAFLGREGPLWQKESYDHLVRDEVEFNAIRAYIRGNAPNLAFDVYQNP